MELRGQVLLAKKTIIRKGVGVEVRMNMMMRKFEVCKLPGFPHYSKMKLSALRIFLFFNFLKQKSTNVSALRHL